MTNLNLTGSEINDLIELFVERLTQITKPAQRNTVTKLMDMIFQDLLAQQPADDREYQIPAAFVGAIRNIEFGTCVAHARRSQDEMIHYAKRLLDEYATQKPGSPHRDYCAKNAINICVGLYIKSALNA